MAVAPSPLPVLVTDVHRDWIDWLMIGVGVISAVVSVIAIIVALRANRHAKDAEARSREMIATERRRAFDLEILRDLLEALDSHKMRHELFQNPNFTIESTFGARLAMLSHDLPVWRAAALLSTRGLYDRYGVDVDSLPVEEHSTAYENVKARFISELRADLTASVERRMQPEP